MSDPDPVEKPEPTPFEKLIEFTRHVLSVPKSEIDRRESEWQKQRATVQRERKVQK